MALLAAHVEILFLLHGAVRRLNMDVLAVFPVRTALLIDVAISGDLPAKTHVEIRLEAFVCGNRPMRAAVVVSNMLRYAAIWTGAVLFVGPALGATHCVISTGSWLASWPRISPFDGVGPGAAFPAVPF